MARRGGLYGQLGYLWTAIFQKNLCLICNNRIVT
jgi:hypothetical protein